jgi:hypothetical protein
MINKVMVIFWENFLARIHLLILKYYFYKTEIIKQTNEKI